MFKLINVSCFRGPCKLATSSEYSLPLVMTTSLSCFILLLSLSSLLLSIASSLGHPSSNVENKMSSKVKFETRFIQGKLRKLRKSISILNSEEIVKNSNILKLKMKAMKALKYIVIIINSVTQLIISLLGCYFSLGLSTYCLGWDHCVRLKLGLGLAVDLCLGLGSAPVPGLLLGMCQVIDDLSMVLYHVLSLVARVCCLAVSVGVSCGDGMWDCSLSDTEDGSQIHNGDQ